MNQATSIGMPQGPKVESQGAATTSFDHLIFHIQATVNSTKEGIECI